MPIDDISVELAINGRSVRLGRGEAVRFAGDATVSLVELDRPGRVLNVMSKAAASDHAVTVESEHVVCDAAVLLEDGGGGNVGDLMVEPDRSDWASLKVAAIRFVASKELRVPAFAGTGGRISRPASSC